MRLTLQSGFKIWKPQQGQKTRSHNLTTPLILISTTLVIRVIGIFSYLVVRGIILQQLQAKALLQVRQQSDEIDQWLAIRKAEIQTIANTEIVRSLEWSVIAPYLRAEVERIHEFFILAVTHPDGSHYNTRIGKTNVNVKHRDDIQTALAGKNHISDPFISPITRINVVAITTPIRQTYDPASHPIGALNGNLRVARVTEVINRLHYGDGSYAFALNSIGQVITHPNPALISTSEKPMKSLLESTDPSLAAIAHRIVYKEQGIELTSIDGTWKYVAHVPLKQAHWSIALVIPRENIESELAALNLLASILGGLLVIAAIMAWQQIQLTERMRAQVVLLSTQEKALQQQARELSQTLRELKQTQTHLEDVLKGSFAPILSTAKYLSTWLKP